ncbi:lycopene cyclase domain-containing protein [Curtobacterium sp. MCBD17_013]|uniref:lycopene cyclase domain-containing protein n=1 Tax=unclassified Curtobacterium TaxID=257496 RepID=UPI000DA8B1A1|nr:MULTISPECIES: lycopene cyclase domain-containing protein [unclassified Curtobacterium]PZE78256.1 lycopene cyclase domain-containing protein [Curtobacterium sp. MCBD17_019]PZF63719.1 lycopene cyclase domain-containing protein [Curtobacterium sp. MCBD17_013]WIB67885.1 lycopene cyclase domain-containing protein [Curtobacterium sp. MCBD17_035]WIE55086.1 lycopene cyclase domain-containing protein [Curtobacterium sp. MCBD17_003]
MPGLYLAGLVVALVGMTVLDARFRLFFWRGPRRAAAVMAVGIAYFLVWDLAGIGLGVFHRGPSSWLIGVQVAPEVPVEELFFLALLCYVTMDLIGFVRPVVERTAPPRVEPPARRTNGVAR